MANPQIEDGHVKLANEIVEHLSQINLSAYEWRVLWAIWRKTYGWHKKSDSISYTQFQQITGLKRWHIARAINRLKKRNIITVSGNKHRLDYSFQKDYEVWLTLPKKVTRLLPKEVTKSLPNEVTEIENRSLPLLEKSLPEEVMESLPKEVNTKAIKHYTKAKEEKKVSPDPNVKKTLDIISQKLGYQIPHYPREAKEVKRALQMNFTMEQFIACWEKMKSFSFWYGKWLPLAKVTDNLGEFVAGRLKDFREVSDGKGKRGTQQLPEKFTEPKEFCNL